MDVLQNYKSILENKKFKTNISLSEDTDMPVLSVDIDGINLEIEKSEEMDGFYISVLITTINDAEKIEEEIYEMFNNTCVEFDNFCCHPNGIGVHILTYRYDFECSDKFLDSIIEEIQDPNGVIQFLKNY